MNDIARAFLDAAPEPGGYAARARDELEPLLALWPGVIAVPTTERVTRRDLIRLRAFPVHPLGVASDVRWADGRPCSPAEFFFHDVDHARFKLREDLLALGREVPDPYQGGTTLDPGTGRHRTILDRVGPIGDALWNLAPGRARLLGRVLRAVETGPLADAAELLLFEILHEKSHAPENLARELGNPAHLAKLRRKEARGFWGPESPPRGALARLEDARRLLLEVA